MDLDHHSRPLKEFVDDFLALVCLGCSSVFLSNDINQGESLSSHALKGLLVVVVGAFPLDEV